MARIRSLKPDFFLSEQVASVAYEWRLLFAGLWTQADRAGRLVERPMRLKAALFPYDAVDVHAGLVALESAGLILRYVVDGQRLIAIPTFTRHQQPHMHEAQSRLPAPPDRPVKRTNGRAALAPYKHSASTSAGTDAHGSSPSDPDPDPDPGTDPTDQYLKNAPKAARASARGHNGHRTPVQVEILAAMVLRDVLPLGLPAGDVPEAAKSRAAQLHLTYDGRSIDRAIARARAQARKAAT